MSSGQSLAKSKNRSADTGSSSSSRKAAGARRTPAAAPLNANYRAGVSPALKAPLQAKFTIGRSDDPFEKEADAVADHVVNGRRAPPATPVPAAGLDSVAQRDQEEDEKQEQPLQTRTIQPETENEEDSGEMDAQPQCVQRQLENENIEEETPQPQLIQAETKEKDPEEAELQPQYIQRQSDEKEVEDNPPQTKLIQAATDKESEDEVMQPRSIQRQLEGNDTKEEEAPQPSFIQRKTDEAAEEDDIQTKMFEQPRRKAANDEPASSTQLGSGFSGNVDRMRGQGASLPADVRDDMGDKIGADFSGVGVHTGQDAADLNRQINARAFTLGNDVFFGAGEYSPNSRTGQRLLAHELTHVAQQSGQAGQQKQPKLYRAEDDGDDSEDSGSTEEEAPTVNTEAEYEGPEGTASADNTSITISEIHFPDIDEKEEKTGSSNVRIRKGSEERDTRQISEWSNLTSGGDGLNEELNRITEDAWQSGNESDPTYFLKVGRRVVGGSFLVGTRQQILDRVIRPYWTPEGDKKIFHVDHKKEYQLKGDDTSPPGNLWLLESTTNLSSGSIINSRINTKLEELLTSWTSSRKPDVETARNTYDVTLEQIHWDVPVAGEKDHYTVNDIAEEAKQLDPVRPLGRRAVRRAGLDPGEGKFVVFNNSSGGRARTIDLPAGGEGEEVPFTDEDEDFIDGFQPSTASFIGEDSNYIQISGTLWADNPAIYGHGIPTAFSISRMSNLPRAGYLNFQAAERKIEEIFAQGEVEASAMSPLQLTNVGMDELGTPVVEGVVNTDISFLQGADIGFFIRGNNVGIEKTFTSSDLNTPSPFEIEEASLTVSLSTQDGLRAEGSVDFKLEGIGEGTITADASTSEAFKLAGDFNFDERIFGRGTSAQARMTYEEGEWSVGGTLTIPDGKISGVESATINVDYSESEGFSAQGDAELDIPGVESASLSITQNEEAGFVIGGTVNLSGDTPGIRGGSLTAQLQERPEGDGYSISASGEAQPDIPGIDSNLLVEYEDGAFTAELEAEYSRGMLSGRIRAGVTNRTPNENGELSETAEPDDPLTVFGGGSLTIQIAPWLEGTAEVEFSPEGELTVVGRIGLPDELEIFPRREIDKSILNIAAQAPIVPGVVAEIGGGLDAEAGIGPGVIDQLDLSVTYNPDHEEDTTITGNAHLRVPADAGLRLSVRAGIGLGITGASATGGLEIGGTLGIEGAAEAGVHVDWSPSSGLELNAEVDIHAQPAFTFDISGYVSVRVFGASIYDETMEFASYRFGSDYRFGIRLPIEYREGEPFDISLDDVEFEVPDIDTDELLEGLVERVT